MFAGVHRCPQPAQRCLWCGGLVHGTTWSHVVAGRGQSSSSPTVAPHHMHLRVASGASTCCRWHFGQCRIMSIGSASRPAGRQPQHGSSRLPPVVQLCSPRTTPSPLQVLQTLFTTHPAGNASRTHTRRTSATGPAAAARAASCSFPASPPTPFPFALPARG